MKALSILSLLIFNCHSNIDNIRVIDTNCISLNDSSTVHYLNYIRTNNIEEMHTALSFVNKALDCDSTYQIALYNKYSYLLMLKDSDGLITTAKRIHELEGNSPSALTLLSSAYRQIGDTQRSDSLDILAFNLSSQLLKTDKCNITLLSIYYSLYVKKHGKEEAINDLNKKNVCSDEIYDRIVLTIQSCEE